MGDFARNKMSKDAPFYILTIVIIGGFYLFLRYGLEWFLMAQ